MKKANTFRQFQKLQIGDKFKTNLAEGKVLIVEHDKEQLCQGCVFDLEKGDKSVICEKVACDPFEVQNGGYSVLFKEVEE